VWNQEGATLNFSVLPAWFQTNWFLFLCILAALFVVWSIYRLRVRQVARVLRLRFDERLVERTRIARDLHDTLLQTIQGSKLVADNALDPDADPATKDRALEQLSGWLGRATQEGRTALNSLRSSTEQRNNLGDALQHAIDECRTHNAIEASFSVIGDSKDTHAFVREELYRIGDEAIRNASKHSRGSRLEVELSYTQDLILRIRDNGIGIDPSVADQGKQGHYGLEGMRERAARIGSKLTVVSSPNSGTEVTLVVPGRIVFRTPNHTRLGNIKRFFTRSNSTLNPN
jgi:signal transduction histidine kinase